MQASVAMKQVVGELAAKHGVNLASTGAWMRLEMPHFDCLVVEAIGGGRISVAHYYQVEHDLVADPEIVFDRDWCPVEMTQVLAGWADLTNRPRAQHSAADFADDWAANIREQGWIEDGKLTRVDRGRMAA